MTAGLTRADERRAAARAWLLQPAGPVPHVKLCGMFRACDIDALLSARPDMCGFIVGFPKSHRNVEPEQLADLTARLQAAEEQAAQAAAAAGERPPVPIWRVGVFVDMAPAQAARTVRECNLDLVQLHGHEDARYVAELRHELPGAGIVQAFRVAAPEDVAHACASEADLILLDSGQGSGAAFDWQLATQATRPFLLAGGLGPENVAQAVSQTRPWGVDMSSGIETAKLKDAEKMLAAVAAVQGAAEAAEKGVNA